MENIIIATLISLAPVGDSPNNQGKEDQVQMAVMCFKSGERRSGMNKICYYNCAGSEAAITVGSAQLCPLSIKN